MKPLNYTREDIIRRASDKLNLFSGPLNFQDGSVYLKEGETATDHQIWYTKQLLEGIDGASSVE